MPSDAIRERILKEDPFRPVITLYNVFPTTLAEGLSAPGERRADSQEPVRLHWFGQTIGKGRGLRSAIEAMAPLGDRIEFHCRGTDCSPSFLEFRAHAERCRVRFVHYPLIDHDKLIQSLGRFHIGLALEQSSYPHYELTVTNKLFGYLLGGLAIAATNTSGQRESWRLPLRQVSCLRPVGVKI